MSLEFIVMIIFQCDDVSVYYWRLSFPIISIFTSIWRVLIRPIPSLIKD